MRFKKVSTYLHIAYNILISIVLYYVGSIHKLKKAYTDQALSLILLRFLHAILLNIN